MGFLGGQSAWNSGFQLEAAAGEKGSQEPRLLHIAQSGHHVISRKIRKARMLTDFSSEYSQRSDDELLHLATQRRSLTTEAVAALDAELRRRNLTESDRVEHQKFVKRVERREGRTRHWKIPGLKNQLSWRDSLEAFGTMALISFTYVVLPRRYHLNPDWLEAAVIVMITSVVIAFWAISWRKIAFWMSLGISSAIQLLVAHTFIRGDFSRAAGRVAMFLGLALFLSVYAIIGFVQRKLYGKEAPESV